MIRFIIYSAVIATLALAAAGSVACTREVEVERVVRETVEVPVTVAAPIAPMTAEPTAAGASAPTPAPTDSAPAAPAGPSIYKMALFAEPISRNYWNYYGGPAGSVWTGYVLSGYTTSLYGYSPQSFNWVPVAAADLPEPPGRETDGGTDYWTVEVNLKAGMQWSDGEPLTADDFVFTVNTVLDLDLGSNWASAVDRAFLDRVEALDRHRIKIYFKAADAAGNPQTPGLSVWQFGLAFMPIMPAHYWAPVVEGARAAGDGAQQIEALFAHIPDDAPTAGGYAFGKWEPGAYYENSATDNYFRQGATVAEYAGGAYSEANDRTGYETVLYGAADGSPVLEFEVGPHVDATLFNIYGNQDAAVLSLTNGDVDFMFNPLGMEKGFQDRIRATEGLEIITNPDVGMFYLGFNTRHGPMSHQEFRQAVATLIDKEFVAGKILQDAAIPMYSLVPEGNLAWHNSKVPKFGQGLDRGQRVAQAVALLQSAGFTWEREPEVSDDGLLVTRPGEGLKMPDGSAVPMLEIMAPSAGYDPLRATYAIWIERWLNELGIPARANLLGFNVIVSRLYSDNVAEELDMWILGWGLSIFPDYMEDFFHSRNAPEGEVGGDNWGGYANPEFDALAFELLSETTIAGAHAKSSELQEFLAVDLPYVPLFTIPKLDPYRTSRIDFPYTKVLGGLTGQNGMQQIAQIK